MVGDGLRSLHSRAPAASNPLVLIRVLRTAPSAVASGIPRIFFYTKKAALSDCRNFAKKMVVGDGFEPSKAWPVDLQSTAFDRSATPPQKVFSDKIIIWSG